MMQKDWIRQEMPHGCGMPPGYAVTQRVESPLQCVQRLPVVGQARSGDVGPGGQGPVNSTTNSTRRTTPHPPDEPEQAPDKRAARPPRDLPDRAARLILRYPVLLRHPDPGRS